MFVERLINLIERNSNFRFSQQSTRLLSQTIRFLLILSFTFALIRLAPTMADELTPGPDNEVITVATPDVSAQPSASASPEPQPTSTAVPVPTEEPIAPVPTATPSPSTSVATVLENQSMQLRVPASLLVDPRARAASISKLSVSGPQNLLVCISSGSMVSDVYLKNYSDSDFGAQTLVAGDRTSNLQVTGSTDQVLAILNGGQGIRVSSPNSTVSTHNLTFRFVAISAPTLDSKLCEKGWPVNSRTLTFRELGLGIEMKKGDVILKR